MFIRVYLSQTDHMAGNKISDAPENDSFAVHFIHLELKRGLRKSTCRWEKAKLLNL